MITYESNNICFIMQIEGSIMPKAFVFTLHSILITVGAHFYLRLESNKENWEFLQTTNQSVVWSGLVIVLGICMSMRTNKAYARFWEGITLVKQMQAEWFEATSNLIAFSMVACKKDESFTKKVNHFQQVLVRLMSFMHGTALRQIGGNEEDFDVLNMQSLDEDSLQYLADCEDRDVNRVEVLLHWIQVLVTDSAADGTLAVAPPILTRAYQTLSRGMVNLQNARKLADVPFPFPLSQLTIFLMIIASILTPIFMASMVDNVVGACTLCFLPIFGMWGLTFMAGELEQPFGSDPNDLPLSLLQYEFNLTLLMLLDPEASRAPHLIEQYTQPVDVLRMTLGNADPLSRTNSLKIRLNDQIQNKTNFAPTDEAACKKKQATSSHKAQLEQRVQRNKRVSFTMLERKASLNSAGSSNGNSDNVSSFTGSVPASETKAPLMRSGTHEDGLEDLEHLETLRLVSIPEDTGSACTVSPRNSMIECSAIAMSRDSLLSRQISPKATSTPDPTVPLSTKESSTATLSCQTSPKEPSMSAPTMPLPVPLSAKESPFELLAPMNTAIDDIVLNVAKKDADERLQHVVNIAQDRLEALLDATTEASQVLVTLLTEPSMKVLSKPGSKSKTPDLWKRDDSGSCRFRRL